MSTSDSDSLDDIIPMDKLIEYEKEYEKMYDCMQDPESEDAKFYIENTEEPPAWLLKMKKK